MSRPPTACWVSAQLLRALQPAAGDESSVGNEGHKPILLVIKSIASAPWSPVPVCCVFMMDGLLALLIATPACCSSSC